MSSGEAFTIDVLHNGAPTDLVDEGLSIDIVIGCGISKAENVRIFVGEEPVFSFPVIERGQTFAITYDVGTLIGPSEVTIRDSGGALMAPGRRFFVRSKMLPLDVVDHLRKKHVPKLAKDLKLADDAVGRAIPTSRRALVTQLEAAPTTQKLFAEEVDHALLVKYSDKLLTLSDRHVKRLSYRSILERKIRKSSIRGRINWTRTAIVQAQRGLEGPMYHVCERRRRSFATPLNQLLVDFHSDLLRAGAVLYDHIIRAEEEKNYWNRRLGRPDETDTRNREALKSLRRLLGRHHQTLTLGVFDEARALVQKRRPDWRRMGPKLHGEAQRQKNRSYRELYPLYQEYCAHFHRQRTEERTLEGASMEEVYKLWLAVEIAHALGLAPVPGETFSYASEDERFGLRYDAIAEPGPKRTTWLDSLLTIARDVGEDGRPAGEAYGEPPTEPEEKPISAFRSGPDIVCNYDGEKMVMDAVYLLNDRETERARLESLLGKVAARHATVGVLAYPGERLRVNVDIHQGSRPVVMAVVPLRASPETIRGAEGGAVDPTRPLVGTDIYLRAVIRELGVIAKIVSRYAAIERPPRLLWKRLRLRLKRRVADFESLWAERYFEPAKRALEKAIESTPLPLGEDLDDDDDDDGES